MLVKIITVVVFCSGIIVIPIMLVCNDEICFRKIYKTNEVIGTCRGESRAGSHSSLMYIFEVNGIEYMTYSSLSSLFQQANDQFMVLYNIENPDKNLILFRKPIIPKVTAKTIGKLDYLKISKKNKEIIIGMKYSIDRYKNLYKYQYFSIEEIKILKKLYEENKDIIIDVVPENVERAFLNLNETRITNRL